MDTETYQGWKNYPTWCVNLWLSNDEGLYHDMLSLARGYDDPEDAWRFAAEVKAYVETLLPDLEASFVSDLLNYAVGEVDWAEIAEAWIRDANE